MKTKTLYLAIILLFSCSVTHSQVGIGTQSPDSTALLDLQSESKGLLVPRLSTAAQLGIKNPATGLLVFNLDFLRFYYYDGQQWLSLSSLGGDTLQVWQCGDSIYYDGENYATVQVGAQCWLQKNLNTGIRINGGAEPVNNGITEKYCYNDDPANCLVYGGLYSWNEMMQYASPEGTQGICPSGWLLPSDADWASLVSFLGGESIAGGKLKEEGATHWLSPNTGATNESGFTALPGGYRALNENFPALGVKGAYWSSSLFVTGYAYYRELNNSTEAISRNYGNASMGYSVRCLNGISCRPPDAPSNPVPADMSLYQPCDITLGWECTDPDNNPLVFDVYFDTLVPPQLVQSNCSAFSFDPGPLLWGKTYYWKIEAFDPGGLSADGPVWNFSTLLAPGSPCPGDSTLVYGGKTYHTVQIGEQCWLKENLDIGTWISDAKSQSDNDTIEKYCYNNTEDSCSIYGGLYQWNEMKQYVAAEGVQGICPDGWYLPTDAEWGYMVAFLDGESFAGGKMKEEGLVHWATPNTGATNASRFTALPGGWRNFSAFSGIREQAFFWGSRMNTGSAFYRFLRSDQENIVKLSTGESLAMSVRCIRAVVVPPPPPVPCPGDTTVIYEGKTYPTVMIGGQCWLAENLDVGTMIPGDSLQKDNTVIEKYCYHDDEENCDIYGGLYSWHEMMQYSTTGGSQGICPDGWHLPTGAEWWILFNSLGGETVAGGKLKESGTAHWASPNTGATNESVFTALPGGFRSLSGDFYAKALNGYFWSSSVYNDPYWVWMLGLFSSSAEIYWNYYHPEEYANSVRCIRD